MALQFIDERTVVEIGRVELRAREAAASARKKGRMMRIWAGLLANLDADGPRSVAQFERAMRGTRSLAG